jgi:hypothetical protein
VILVLGTDWFLYILELHANAATVASASSKESCCPAGTQKCIDFPGDRQVFHGQLAES